MVFTSAGREQVPLESLDGRVTLGEGSRLRWIDLYVEDIRRLAEPSDTILDLSASSLLFVLGM